MLCNLESPKEYTLGSAKCPLTKVSEMGQRQASLGKCSSCELLLLCPGDDFEEDMLGSPAESGRVREQDIPAARHGAVRCTGHWSH